MNVGSTLKANAKTTKCAEPATVFRPALRVVLSLTDFGTGRWHSAGQGDGQEPIKIDLLSYCASRYDTSFTATALKWLDITDEPAMLVVARDHRIDVQLFRGPVGSHGKPIAFYSDKAGMFYCKGHTGDAR